MKSSKLENVFNYPPPLEDSRTPSPLTYCEPVRPSFDPDYSVAQPKSTMWENPHQMVRWSQGGERSVSIHQQPGGGSDVSLSLWGQGSCGLSPESSGYVESSVSSTSPSVWREIEGRSLCNTTWSSGGPIRPPMPSYEESRRPKNWTLGISNLGVHAQFSQKSSVTVGPLVSRFENLSGPQYQTESSYAPSTSFTGNLNQSPYYPLMLSSLGNNIAQNVYKPGHYRPMVCNFCKNNKEVPDIYLNHHLYDPITKILSCPVLRKHVCEICGGTGDQAHTLQYCPLNREKGFQSKVPVLLKTRTITNSTGKIRRN